MYTCNFRQCVFYGSCHIEKAFWVAWQDNTLSVGQGVHPNSVLLEYTPAEGNIASVTGVSVYSGHATTDPPGYWEIARDQGEYWEIARDQGEYWEIAKNRQRTWSLLSVGERVLHISVFSVNKRVFCRRACQL